VSRLGTKGEGIGEAGKRKGFLQYYGKPGPFPHRGAVHGVSAKRGETLRKETGGKKRHRKKKAKGKMGGYPKRPKKTTWGKKKLAGACRQARRMYVGKSVRKKEKSLTGGRRPDLMAKNFK